MTSVLLHRARLSKDAQAHRSTVSLVWDQTGYTLREWWRSRVFFIFTFLVPLTVLVVLGFVFGTQTIEGTGVPIMQVVTPNAIAVGVLFAAFPPVASTVAQARETGVLKRVRGTPLRPWVYLAGRLASAVAFALGSLLTLVVVAVSFYGVRIMWSTALATTVTVVVAVACFAALGLAVATLTRSAGVADAASFGAVMVLSYVSGVFSDGSQTASAGRVADVLPLKPFADALRAQFDPSAAGSGWDVRALAIMAAWTLGATVVAARAFRSDPHQTASRGSPVPRTDGAPVSVAVTAELRATAPGRPSTAAMLLTQVRHITVAAWRDVGWVVFAVAVPVGQFAYLAYSVAPAAADVTVNGLPYLLATAAGMMTCGAAITCFIFMPDALVRARDQKLLKRLRGTPLTPEVYAGGRILSALVIAYVTAVLVLAVGVAFFALSVSWAGLPLATVVLLLGSATLGACGIALAAHLPSSNAVVAVGLAVLMPLSFFSNVIVFPGLPAWMGTVGSLFPLKHMADSVARPSRLAARPSAGRAWRYSPPG